MSSLVPPPLPLTLPRILSAGYLPEVLPPCFSTETFGAAFAAGKTPPPDFRTSTVVPISSRCSRYNQARVGGSRRVFSIPNPVHFFRLAECFLANWPAIEAQVKKSPISLTKPLLSSGRRCFRPTVDFRDRPAHRARVRSTARAILRCDISRFFPSIYTHSIPWAFHTKPVAKKNFGPSLFGNQLDAAFRNLQDKQTVGIPIGQDISRVIAEAILAAIETDMQLKKWPAGMRCIDDYEVAFLSATEAEAFRYQLERALTEYELALNPMKTAILSLPQLLMDRWDAELRRFDLGGSGVAGEDEDESNVDLTPFTESYTPSLRREDLLLFINKAIELQSEFKGEAVLRFSLKRLAHLSMDVSLWPIYQDYLFHCALNQPETLRLVVSNLLKAVFLDEMPLDTGRFRIVLNNVIIRAAPLGHSSDVCWALWAALLFRMRVSARAAGALEVFEDSASGCLASQAAARGLMPKRFALQWLKTVVSAPSALYGEHWLLVYESIRNGWPGCPTLADPCFDYLRKQKVQFFTESHAEDMRKQLREFSRKKTQPPPSDDDDDDSDSEDAFDNWWFHDDD